MVRGSRSRAQESDRGAIVNPARLRGRAGGWLAAARRCPPQSMQRPAAPPTAGDYIYFHDLASPG
jgi:hypothetical protein